MPAITVPPVPAMGKAARGRPLHGWIIVDKPSGVTSAAVVGRVRRATNAAKAGHGGTLDPLATGVLPIALGEATKTVSYVVDGAKSYRFTVRWGEKRDTDDAEGQVVETSPVRPTADAIAHVIGRFAGDIEQVPPAYSAIKVGGRRAYALARADVAVELTPRPVRVDRIQLIEQPDGDSAVFEVCSRKGVYMRSLARDLGLALGTFGYVSALRRTRVGPFREAAAVPLAELENLEPDADVTEYVLPVGVALADIPALSLTEAEARRLQHGRPIAALPVAIRSPLDDAARNGVVCAMASGRPVALAQIQGGEIRPLRVLNL
jgi:tRNA pseudouridine55 synthase